MKFSPPQQHEFDLLIGRTVEAWQEHHLPQALDYLHTARAMLIKHNITDDFDWSGWYDLKIEVLTSMGDTRGAAMTAKTMLETINPQPDDFSEAHHGIIQDSLISAAIVASEYWLQQEHNESTKSELQRFLAAGITMAYFQQRDDKYDVLQALHNKVFLSPYIIPDDDSGE